MKEADNNIVKRIKNGDTSCLEELVRAHKSYCIHGLRKKLKCSEEEAEDLFIEALLELRDKILSGKLEHLINVKSYIFGICHNMWLSDQRIRQRNMERQREVEWYYQQYVQEDFLLADDDDYKGQLVDLAYEALENIDEKCRTIIRYFYIEKRSMTEIAEILGFASPDVAKTSKSRCFKKLVESVNELRQG